MRPRRAARRFAGRALPAAVTAAVPLGVSCFRLAWEFLGSSNGIAKLMLTPIDEPDCKPERSG